MQLTEEEKNKLKEELTEHLFKQKIKVRNGKDHEIEFINLLKDLWERVYLIGERIDSGDFKVMIESEELGEAVPVHISTMFRTILTEKEKKKKANNSKIKKWAMIVPVIIGAGTLIYWAVYMLIRIADIITKLNIGK